MISATLALDISVALENLKKFDAALAKLASISNIFTRGLAGQPPFPCSPVRPNGCFSGCPPKANS